MSALNLDRKLDRLFGDRKEMLKYGAVKQRPYACQDDSLVLVDDVEHLRGLASIRIDLSLTSLN